jgi:ribosomal-protein-alanine N-acetyltransferase
MTQSDIAQVAAIEQTAFSQPWSEHAFLESLANESTCFLVAEEERAIAGYAGMYLSFEEGEITNVAVAERFRKNGVGEALIRKLLLDAPALGVDRIMLEVRISNEPAIRLYEKCGFHRIGTRKGFYDFPKEDADIMVWEASIE